MFSNILIDLQSYLNNVPPSESILNYINILINKIQQVPPISVKDIFKGKHLNEINTDDLDKKKVKIREIKAALEEAILHFIQINHVGEIIKKLEELHKSSVKFLCCLELSNFEFLNNLKYKFHKDSEVGIFIDYIQYSDYFTSENLADILEANMSNKLFNSNRKEIIKIMLLYQDIKAIMLAKKDCIILLDNDFYGDVLDFDMKLAILQLYLIKHPEEANNISKNAIITTILHQCFEKISTFYPATIEKGQLTDTLESIIFFLKLDKQISQNKKVKRLTCLQRIQSLNLIMRFINQTSIRDKEKIFAACKTESENLIYDELSRNEIDTLRYILNNQEINEIDLKKVWQKIITHLPKQPSHFDTEFDAANFSKQIYYKAMLSLPLKNAFKDQAVIEKNILTYFALQLPEAASLYFHLYELQSDDKHNSWLKEEHIKFDINDCYLLITTHLGNKNSLELTTPVIEHLFNKFVKTGIISKPMTHEKNLVLSFLAKKSTKAYQYYYKNFLADAEQRQQNYSHSSSSQKYSEQRKNNPGHSRSKSLDENWARLIIKQNNLMKKLSIKPTSLTTGKLKNSIKETYKTFVLENHPDKLVEKAEIRQRQQEFAKIKANQPELRHLEIEIGMLEQKIDSKTKIFKEKSPIYIELLQVLNELVELEKEKKPEVLSASITGQS